MAWIAVVARGLLIVCLPTSLHAQQMQMPPILIGAWSYTATFYGDTIDRCGALAEARGMTITPDGKLISNDGSRTCALKSLNVWEPFGRDTRVGWSYSGECVLRAATEPRTVPMYGKMALEFLDGTKRSQLLREESQQPFSIFWQDPPPKTDWYARYERCPVQSPR
jgi:hypothetical protein